MPDDVACCNKSVNTKQSVEYRVLAGFSVISVVSFRFHLDSSSRSLLHSLTSSVACYCHEIDCGSLNRL